MTNGTKNRRFAGFASDESAFDEPSTESLRAGTDAIFGGSQDVGISTNRQIAKGVSINEIYPDMMQPRRAMPSAARGVWNGEPSALHEAFSVWWGMAQDESGLTINLEALFAGGVNEDDLPSVPDESPLAESFLKLVALAASIQQEGLTNPITVVKMGTAYSLETGERRWMAYHLLRWVTQDEKWAKIPARVVDQFSVWRQAAENNTRADLNAIGKARQFALLLMDLLAQDGQRFAPFQSFGFEREQAFYAQVADGETYRVPRGKGETLLAAMGLKNGNQLRLYRNLLRLSPDVWLQADDENWTEFRIRKLVYGGDTVSVDTVEVAELGVTDESVSENKSASPTLPPGWKQYKNVVDRVSGALRGELTLTDDEFERELNLFVERARAARRARGV